MRIKLQTGDFKIEEQDQQLPAEVEKYAGRDNHSIRDFNKTPHGVPSGGLEYTVDASFDMRPVNAVDFNARFVTETGTFINSSNWTQQFSPTLNKLVNAYPGGTNGSPVIPAGNVFIVRSISAYLNASVGVYQKVAFYFPRDAFVSVLLNNQPIPAASNIPVDWNSDSIPVYFIVDELTRVTIRYDYYAYSQPVYSVLVWPTVVLYGNLLVKSGSPKQFEGANVKAVK